MFWSSVFEGLRLLRHPEIWVGALIVGALPFAFLIAVGRLAKRSGARMVGCLTFVVGLLVLPSLLSALYFAFVLPLVFGAADATPLAVVRAHFDRILYAALVAAAVRHLISLVPFIPRAAKTAFSVFAHGVIIVGMLLDSPFREAAGLPAVTAGFPGFWVLLAFLAVSVALSYLVYAPALIHERRRKHDAPVLDESGKPVARERPSHLMFATFAVGMMVVKLPVFMYLLYLHAARMP